MQKLFFWGNAVGNGQVKQLNVKIQSILKYLVPKTKKELIKFLEMVGYYRQICQNFSITAPLTNLLRKDQDYIWSNKCQYVFVEVKSLLLCNPVLKLFILMMDASDLGAGTVLMKCDVKGVEYPICYHSHKFIYIKKLLDNRIEKKTSALVLALQHFDVYQNTTRHPIMVYTDHNLLTFINKMKNHNQ